MSRAILALILTTVTISAVAQLVLKAGMSTQAARQALIAGGIDALVAVALSPLVWLGLALYGLGTVLWLGVLSRLDVGQAYPFVGLGFVITMSFGVIFLDERLSLGRLLGTLFVAVGVVLIARAT